MKKLIPLLLLFCLLLTACGKAGDNPANVIVTRGSGETETAALNGAASAFELYPAYLTLPLGQHLTLDADSAPAGKKLVWASSDPSVATVDDNGRITPIAAGETVITAALADNVGVSASCGVLVAADGNIFLWEG